MVTGVCGIAGGCTGAEGFAGLAGCFGMYSGPGWPQPASIAAATIMSAREDFTIRITV
jgi:hypothetical protein